jgi:uncharacterized membrane protein YdcZ (DUF606 family)
MCVFCYLATITAVVMSSVVTSNVIDRVGVFAEGVKALDVGSRLSRSWVEVPPRLALIEF